MLIIHIILCPQNKRFREGDPNLSFPNYSNVGFAQWILFHVIRVDFLPSCAQWFPLPYHFIFYLFL